MSKSVGAMDAKTKTTKPPREFPPEIWDRIKSTIGVFSHEKPLDILSSAVSDKVLDFFDKNPNNRGRINRDDMKQIIIDDVIKPHFVETKAFQHLME